MKLAKKALFLLISTLTLTSCARQISSDVYSARQVGETSMTYMGIVRNVREVSVEQSEQLDQNQTGIVGGGLAGGVLGNAIGRGNLFPTAAGAIAGAITGSLVEKNLKKQIALEYVVELYNGGLMTVVQGPQDAFYIGQPVYVMVSQSGRSRITSQ